MSKDYSLKEIIGGLDPITYLQPRGMHELANRLRWEQGWQGAGPLSFRSLKRTVGGGSLRQTIRTIDGNNPPGSLLQAFERMGFPIGGGVTKTPNGPISLRKIASRINSTDSVSLRFLSYNTYLLPGVRIPLGRWIDNTVGWDALEWFGIPFGGALLGILGLSSIPGFTLAAILKTAGFTPSKVIKTVTTIDLNNIATFNAKPALKRRSQLLGERLGVFDVCCLSEVFKHGTRQEILTRIDQTSSGTTFASTSGPDETGSWIIEGSGLFFLARAKYPIVKTERIVFANRGNKRKDTDAWANKGVLLNFIDLGIGQLELYQTHLYYGNDLPEFSIPGIGIPILSKPSDEERSSVRLLELRELAHFYRLHHDPKNIAIITGDFNMSGADVREYADIRQVMDKLNMRDLWAWDVYGNNPSEGHTNRLTDGDMSQWQRDFKGDYNNDSRKWGGVCRPLGQVELQEQWKDYCDDSQFHEFPPRGVGRFDYIFVENPTVSHRYHLEASRILRRPFPLSREIEGEKYLSDHLGLEVTLYCSPRS